MGVQEEVQIGIFVRKLLISNPKLNLEQLQKAWDDAGMPSEDRPQDYQIIHNIRYYLKKKYKLKQLEDLPVKKNGEPNITALIKILLSIHPKLTEPECSKMLKQDGIEYCQSLFSRIINEKSNPQNPSDSEVNSIEKIQKKGPRSRFLGKFSEKQGNPASHSSVNKSELEIFNELEDEIDVMMNKVRTNSTVLDVELLNKLRDVRRHIILLASQIEE